MKLYTTLQGHWTGTQADARKLAKQHSICDVFEVPVDKKGLLGFLNAWQVGRHEATSDEEPATSDKGSAPVVEVEETKIVGETREQYMRKWRQEQADLGAEFNVRIAIEDALFEAPFTDLSNYAAIVIGRLGEVITEGKVDGASTR